MSVIGTRCIWFIHSIRWSKQLKSTHARCFVNLEILVYRTRMLCYCDCKSVLKSITVGGSRSGQSVVPAFSISPFPSGKEVLNRNDSCLLQSIHVMRDRYFWNLNGVLKFTCQFWTSPTRFRSSHRNFPVYWRYKATCMTFSGVSKTKTSKTKTLRPYDPENSKRKTPKISKYKYKK